MPLFCLRQMAAWPYIHPAKKKIGCFATDFRVRFASNNQFTTMCVTRMRCNKRGSTNKTIVLFSACIVNYDDSCGRAFVIGIYLNHLWFSFFGNRRGFGSEERGNARCFQRRHYARRYGLQVKLGNPDRTGGIYGQSICFLITWVLIGDYWATPNERYPISDSACAMLLRCTVPSQKNKGTCFLDPWGLLDGYLEIIG